MKQGINSRRTGNLLNRAGNLQRLAGNCPPGAGIPPDFSRLPRAGVDSTRGEEFLVETARQRIFLEAPSRGEMHSPGGTLYSLPGRWRSMTRCGLCDRLADFA